MKYELIQPATQYAVSAAEFEQHMRIDYSAEDVTKYIKAATAWVEKSINHIAVTSTYAIYLDRWEDAVDLPIYPVQSVSALTHLDENNATQTLLPDSYYLVGKSPATLRLDRDYNRPGISTRKGSIVLNVIAGYASVADVPFDYKAAVLLMAGGLYENREDQVTGTIISENKAVKRLLRGLDYRGYS